MRRAILTGALISLTTAAPLAVGAQTLAEARSSLRAGEYDDAASAYRRLLRQDGTALEARRGLVEALAFQGRYEDAEGVARQAPDALANALGEVLLLRGKLDEAEAAFRRGAEAPGPDRLTAAVNLADLLFRRGRVEEAMADFDAFIDVYNNADGRLSPRDLVAVGRAVHALGRTDPVLFQDALRAFDEAARLDPGWTEPAVRTGDLFLEKYQSPEAKAEYQKVLDANPRDPRALMGMAFALDFDGSGGAREQAMAALEVNPDLPEAHAFLGRLLVSREDYAQGAAEAQKALAVNPSSLEAISVLAAAQYLSDDLAAFRETRARALALNPRYPDLDGTVAELAVHVRRYQQAVERAAAAVALDSLSWRSWGTLGMNQLRTGAIPEGRASLERAFSGDPYNPWFKNNLDLLDTFDRFESVRTPHFELFLHGTEAELLAPYVSAMAEEAYDSLSRRYGAEPPLPVRVELYPSHADFSVRTLGETGLGALGVTFGSLVVMDSPSARQRGEYNWASTLWHEMAHVFHLAMTEHRVPRWFSEGLSVHEQRAGRPGWGHQPSIPFLQALRTGRLKKVSDLNDGFMRPEYPEQVIFSYYQASLVFQLLEETHGYDAIRTMLAGYREGRSTEELLDAVLGTTADRLDDDFDRYLRNRFAGPLAALAPVGDPPPAEAGIPALEEYVRAHPGDLVGRLRLGALLTRDQRYAEARPHLTEALRMFPEYGGPDSPYRYLAQIHEAQGDRVRAAAALARLNALSESNYDALVKEAALLEELDRPGDAAVALGRAVQVYPYEMDLHTRLATLAAGAGDHGTAVLERQAVVALAPADRAQALYRLAVAQRDAGDRAGARRSVLRALEVAPNYDAALELLLELRGVGGGA
ncbi:MAG TPA: tetratricopeptide repeat protein [Longimicrobiales bacterium]|nr:tetratricopeptide repeat protein [Longimicrobiales bacterium]